MKKLNKKSIISSLAASATLGLLVFSFTGLATMAAGPVSVNLGSAANFVILAKSGISTTGSTSITGDIGVSPIAATAITGFGLVMDSMNTFSTSARVSGKVYAADYMAPTPAAMSAAIGDMQNAYTDAAGRTNPLATELGAGNIGGMTLAPGLYKWSTGVTIPTNVTLSGGANDVWIFQIAQNLTVGSAVQVILSGGAQAANVFWQVAGQTTIGTTAVFNGNILDQTAIVLQTSASLNGRALAQTAVTLDSNNVKISVAMAPPTPTVTPPVVVAVPSTTTVVSGGSSNGGNVSVATSVLNLSCFPVTQNVTLGNLTRVSAVGGDGNYVWSSPDLLIANPNGSSFTANYASVGGKILTVRSAGLVTTCAINVLSNNGTVSPPVIIPKFPATGGGFGQ